MSENFDEYIVKFRYQSEYKNIYIKRDELTLDTLINLAFDAFRINVKGNVKITLRDNNDIIIPREKVLQHVNAFWRNGSFYFDMSYADDPNSRTIDTITPTMIEDYLKEVNQRELLTNCKGKKETDVSSRQKIVQLAVDFMVTNFGDGIDMFHRQLMAQALIKLFPFMGIKNGQDIGIRTLVNGANGGWLNTRLYYVRSAKRKQEQAETANDAETADILPEHNKPYNAKDDVDLLKSLVVSTENLEVFRTKLNSTRKHREQMLKRAEVEIKEHFPYFFTHPLELIPLEFEEKYKNSGVDAYGLIDNWANYRPNLERVLHDHRKTAFATDWDSNVHSLLLLLQLFPSKQVGWNVTATSSNFEASVNKLIQFELTYTPPDELAADSQGYPIIIACGASKSEIDYFCLKLEGKIIPLPSDADGLHVFDLYLKTHKIFDLNYEPSLRNMMIFVENFIYNIKGEHKTTNRMLDISRYLKRDD